MSALAVLQRVTRNIEPVLHLRLKEISVQKK